MAQPTQDGDAAHAALVPIGDSNEAAITPNALMTDTQGNDAPPAFLEAHMWPTAGLELGQAIGPCVPRVGLESFRGTRGGE